MKAKKLAQVIRQIVREEVQKEVRNVLTEQKAKDNSNVDSISLNEALSQTESEAWPTMKTFNADDARAGFAALQGENNLSQATPNSFEGHSGRVITTDKLDPSVKLPVL